MNNITMDHENIWGHKKFPNPIDRNEKILLVLRQDNSIIKRKLTFGFILILLSFFTKLIIQNYSSMYDNSAWFYFINMIYYIFVCIIMLRFAIFSHNYYLSFWAFTPVRIISYKQNNFFQADIENIWYKNIEKVELTRDKALNTLNDFGNITLSMRGEGEQKNKIFLQNLPNPKYISELLETLIK